MLFNSLHFLIFFPFVTVIYFVIPQKMRSYWLLAASYYFYMCWNPKYVFLLLASTAITFLSGLAMENVKIKYINISTANKRKRWIVALSFTSNIGILFFFKYVNFAVEILQRIFNHVHIYLNVPTFDIILPVGISFYVFQALSYTMDIYRDEIKAEKNFFRYALFVSFFPQLVAGPIERSKNLLKQFTRPKSFDYMRVRSGLLMMLWGFFLKLVIADRCAVPVNIVYADYTAYYGFQLMIANILFALQIYCDFMAYSVIAKGAAKVLGFDLMDNFQNPYFAASIREFWQRWHISLSSWLKDYLYIPLGGNRKGKICKYRNLLITFFVSGLWHGASLTFVVWGLLHGVYQVAGDMLHPRWVNLSQRLKIRTQTYFWKILRILKTFILVDIGWVFFRSESIRKAIHILYRSFNIRNSSLIFKGGVLPPGLDKRNMFILLTGIFMVFISGIMKEKQLELIPWISKQNIFFRYVLYWSLIILIILSLDITGQEFIYFQF